MSCHFAPDFLLPVGIISLCVIVFAMVWFLVALRNNPQPWLVQEMRCDGAWGWWENLSKPVTLADARTFETPKETVAGLCGDRPKYRFLRSRSGANDEEEWEANKVMFGVHFRERSDFCGFVDLPEHSPHLMETIEGLVSERRIDLSTFGPGASFPLTLVKRFIGEKGEIYKFPVSCVRRMLIYVEYNGPLLSISQACSLRGTPFQRFLAFVASFFGSTFLVMTLYLYLQSNGCPNAYTGGQFVCALFSSLFAIVFGNIEVSRVGIYSALHMCSAFGFVIFGSMVYIQRYDHSVPSFVLAVVALSAFVIYVIMRAVHVLTTNTAQVAVGVKLSQQHKSRNFH